MQEIILKKWLKKTIAPIESGSEREKKPEYKWKHLKPPARVAKRREAGTIPTDDEGKKKKVDIISYACRQ